MGVFQLRIPHFMRQFFVSVFVAATCFVSSVEASETVRVYVDAETNISINNTKMTIAEAEEFLEDVFQKKGDVPVIVTVEMGADREILERIAVYVYKRHPKSGIVFLFG